MKTVINRIYLLCIMIMVSLQLMGQNPVKGKVIDKNGEPMVGVTIQVKGTMVGTATDFNGEFSIPAKDKDILVLSFIGYETTEVAYNAATPLKIVLKETTTQLEDVVVVGYGTQKQHEVTGVLTTVDMDKLTETHATESVENMLQGRVAGVNIQLNSGEPGAKPMVIIRGLAAVTREDGAAVSEPLYVVDGVPIISRTGDEFAVTSTNVLADLDPSDIEDMVILKDASAAAIYGSRAANGVILITTKKGKRGRPQINFNVRYGVNFVPKLRDVAGGVKEREQVQRLYDLYAPHGVSMPAMYTDITNPFYNNSSDWQDYLYNTSITQAYNGSVRGAGDFGQYSVSLGYMDSEGILFNSGFERYNTLANTTFNALNNKLSVNTTLALSRTDQSKSPDALSTNYSSLYPLPNSPNLQGIDVYGIGQDKNINDRIRFSTDATIDLASFLTYNIRYSYEYTRASRDKYNENRRTSQTYNSSVVGEASNMLFQNTLTVTPKIGTNHNVSLLLGQSAEKSEQDYTYVGSLHSVPGEEKILDPATMSYVLNRPIGDNIGESNYGASTILSFFSRLNYTFKKKYIVGASLRADGSSKFGVDNRWGIFPSVSAGWNFGDEAPLKNAKWISNGKLRASYGISGTTWDQSYLALGVMDGGALDRYNSMLNISYAGKSGFTPAWKKGFRNEDLTWVTSKMTNIGLDLSLFDDKIEFIIDAYEKLTEGLLLPTSLPTTSGYNEVFRNAADVLNRGVEFTLNTTVKPIKGFTWNMGINLAYNQNRVVELPDGNADIIKVGEDDDDFPSSGQEFGSIVRVGAPLNGFFFYESEGIYQTENEIPVNPKTGERLVGLQGKKLAIGDRKFKDQNNDYIIDKNDRVLCGDPNPEWTGGWTNDFNYKGFGLNVVSTFVIGRDIVNTELLRRLSLKKGFAGSSLPNFDNYSIWEKSGDNAKYPTLNPWSDASQIIKQDSEYIEDGSYFKVKTITLSYTFSKRLLKKLPFTRTKIYCTLDNAITFQNYSGPDAELVTVNGFDDSNGYPMRKMLLFGLSLGL